MIANSDINVFIKNNAIAFNDGNFVKVDNKEAVNPNEILIEQILFHVCLITTNDCANDTICKTIELNPEGINDHVNFDISVYPVPSNGLFKISCSQPQRISEIIVRNASGIKISELQWDSSDGENNFWLDLSPGIYFLDILMDDNRILKKIIIASE